MGVVCYGSFWQERLVVSRYCVSRTGKAWQASCGKVRTVRVSYVVVWQASSVTASCVMSRWVVVRQEGLGLLS